LIEAVNLNAQHRHRLLPPVASFVVLYTLLYDAFGAASPFLPALIEERGIPPELIGVLFGAGTAIRLVSLDQMRPKLDVLKPCQAGPDHVGRRINAYRTRQPDHGVSSPNASLLLDADTPSR
jgi:hypothetical protein